MTKQDRTQLRAIPGFDGYFASCDGTIVSVRSGESRQLKARIHKGYLHVQVKAGAGRASQRKVPVHQLVLLTYVGPRPSPEHVGRHLNGDALDCSEGNLAWGTAADNHADAIRHGTAICLRRGEAHPRTILTMAQVQSVRRSSDSAAVEAARHGVSRSWICRIRKGADRVVA